MKMKKLLSVGAMALVLASFTSIGAFAADRPTNQEIIEDMAALFSSNTSPLTYNVSASTKVKNVIDMDKVEELEEDLVTYGLSSSDYSTLFNALALVDSNASILDNVKAILVANKDNLDDLLSDARDLAQVLRDIENSDAAKKLTIEEDIKEIVESANSSLEVIFGKNVDGYLTMTITQGNRIILQLNSQNSYTISQSLGNNADKLTDLAELFGVLS